MPQTDTAPETDGPVDAVLAPAELYRISLIAGTAGLLFGYDTAVINGALVFLRAAFRLSEGRTEFVASSLLWGCLAGALTVGTLSDRFGRKKILVLSGIIFFFSAVASAVPHTATALICARVFGGVGIGIASSLVPIYLAELAPARNRGRMVTIHQLGIVTGILLAYGVGWGLSFLGSDSWRWMFGFAALPAFFFAVATLTIPESPRWLRLHRNAASSGGWQTQTTGRTTSLLPGTRPESGRLRKALALAVALAIFQQITGINMVLYYGAILFKEHVGLSSQNAVGANVLVGLVNFAFTILAMIVIDRVKRRTLLATSALVMGLALLGLSISFHLRATPTSAILGLLLLYIAAFATGVGPGVWVYITELFPTEFRGRATSVATAALWAGCIFVTNTYLTALRILTASGTFLFYAIMCALLCGFVLLLPETKGRSLESIAAEW